jgi:methylenetetrahydrofolate--tRNA-(uracil-5-)-methyltransferase
MKDYINIIGAGLAGCEASWQASQMGVKVRLFEMKPHTKTPAHNLDSYGELVCSNSLRSDQLENAVGLLKEEMRILNSLIIKCADSTRVPAGGALAVDRDGFSQMITKEIKNNPNIEVIEGEVCKIPDDAITIIASGPLTYGELNNSIRELIGEEYLHFFDASAPIITFDSIDMSKAYKASRYGKGEDDYINCPMEKDEYLAFYNELINAEEVVLKDFEKGNVFEGCMPVEVMAKRGEDTLRFGPLKPVGLTNPHTGKEPYAVVQLRQDNSEASLYNIVGFQTHLKWGEQKRVFGMIPGLQNADFVRYGVMHRNTFINSPKSLTRNYSLKKNPNIYFAGQITGVEGYVESSASGLLAGLNAARALKGLPPVEFPATTAIGALSLYISDKTVKNFQPMNVNFGILEPIKIKIKNKKEKNAEIAKRAIEAVKNEKQNI